MSIPDAIQILRELAERAVRILAPAHPPVPRGR